MSVLFYFFVGAGAIIFQSAVTDYFHVWTTARPDAMVLVTVYLGLHRGRETGLLGGFFLGLFQDALSGGLLGVNALTKGLIGHATGSMRRNVTGRESLFHGALGLFATAFHIVLAGALLTVFLPDLPVPRDYWIEGAKTTAINTFLAPIVIGLLARAEERVLPSAAGAPYPERL